MTGPKVSVVDRPDAGRFELVADGEVLAFADYRVVDGVMVLPHTVTAPAHRGRGLAGTLVGAVLDRARARGLKVDPVCWYVAEYLDAHPEQADLRV